MTFDSSAAWDAAVRMMKANKEVLSVVAGAFFFLPALCQAILAPGKELNLESGDPDQVLELLMTELTDTWYIILPVYLIIYVGSIAVHALLGKSRPPTVGDAIGLGVRLLPSYLAFTALIIIGATLIVSPMFLLKLGAGLGILGVLLSIIFLVVFIIAMIRLSLVAAIFGIEETSNPVTAMERSWNLVKGNTGSVFLFVMLISIAAGIVMAVMSWVVALMGSAASPTIATWIEAVLINLIGAGFSVLMLSVYTAIYLQLTGASGAEAFE